MMTLVSVHLDNNVMGSSQASVDVESSQRLPFAQEDYGTRNRAIREQTSTDPSFSLDFAEEHHTIHTRRSLDDNNAINEDSLDIPDKYEFPVPKVTFNALQEWEGYVLEIGDKKFTARLLDLTADASLEGEEAEIPLAEVSESDRERLYMGSIFRWSIGYECSSSGTKRRVSHIVFRDMPVLSKQDMVAGEKWAEEVLQNMQG